MKDREAVRLALQIAIDTKIAELDSFEGAEELSAEDAAERRRLDNQVVAFRRVLKKRYGEEKTPMEQLGTGGSVSIGFLQAVAEAEAKRKSGTPEDGGQHDE